MKTISVTLDVIHEVRADGLLWPFNPPLSNTCWATFKSKYDSEIPMQDGKPVVDPYKWVS